MLDVERLLTVLLVVIEPEMVVLWHVPTIPPDEAVKVMFDEPVEEDTVLFVAEHPVIGTFVNPFIPPEKW